MLLLDYAYDLPYLQIINSNNIGIAIMQGLSGSFGIVLVVPILLDLEIAQISSLVQILGYINNLVLTTSAMKLPKMFPEAWEKSQFRVPIPVFYALMVITCIAILIQASFMLSSMNIKLILFNAATMAFGFFWAFYRYGSGKAKPTVSYEMA